jgi:flagellar basal body-associated protein FliL
MHESQWLDHHEKRKNYLWLIILIAAVCIAAGIFIRNNSDVLGVSHRQNKETNAPVPQSVPASLPAQSTGLTAAKGEPKKDGPIIAPVQSAPAGAMAEQPREKQETRQVKAALEPKALAQALPQPEKPAAAPVPKSSMAPPSQLQASVPGGNESVPLERVVCRLMDKSQPSIRLSLLLSFPTNKALKQEILVKRDNLKVMVKKTLAAKSMDDMVVDSLRRDLKSDLNSVLENGAITDIEFKEFRIEKVE